MRSNKPHPDTETVRNRR